MVAGRQVNENSTVLVLLGRACLFYSTDIRSGEGLTTAELSQA